MRKIFLYFSLLLFMQTAFASDSLFVRKPQIPILIDRTDNILVEMRVQAHKGMYSTSFPCNSKKEST
mgnify:FL=1